MTKSKFWGALLTSVVLSACGGGGGEPAAPVDVVAPVAAKVGVVFIGDSIVAAWPLEESFPGLGAVNAGVGSQLSKAIAARFPTDVLAVNPRVVVIEAGANDVFYPGGDVSYIASMAAQATAQGITVVLTNVPPRQRPDPAQQAAERAHILEFNANLAQLCSVQHYLCADVFGALVDAEGGLPAALTTDGIHFTPAGYAVWARVLAPLLIQAGVLHG